MGKVLQPLTDIIAPQAPKAPKLPAAPEPPPTEADKAVVEARNKFRAGVIAGSQVGSTVATSALGLNTQAPTAKKSLFGQ